MPTIELVHSITGRNGVTLGAGTIRDFSDREANILIERGLGRPVEESIGKAVPSIPVPLFGIGQSVRFLEKSSRNVQEGRVRDLQYYRHCGWWYRIDTGPGNTWAAESHIVGREP